MNNIERWYRFVLRAYPAGYRAEREDEMIGALLDATTGRRRPMLGETTALVGNGMLYRVRRVPDGRRALQAAGIVGAVVAIVAAAAAVVFSTGRDAGHVVGTVLWCILGASVVGGLLLRGRPRMVATGVTVVAGLVAVGGGSDLMGAYRRLLLPVVVFAVLAAVALPVRRRVSAIVSLAAISAGIVVGVYLDSRGETMFNLFSFDRDQGWGDHVPRRDAAFVDLNHLSPVVPFCIFAASMVLVAWAGGRSVRIASTAAILAIPSALTAELVTRSLWRPLTDGGVDTVGTLAVPAPVGLTAAAVVGAAASIAFLRIARRHEPTQGPNPLARQSPSARDLHTSE
jgi:hypothetical protein